MYLVVAHNAFGDNGILFPSQSWLLESSIARFHFRSVEVDSTRRRWRYHSSEAADEPRLVQKEAPQESHNDGSDADTKTQFGIHAELLDGARFSCRIC